MDAAAHPLALLSLQIDWGADEALADLPVDRMLSAPQAMVPTLARQPAALASPLPAPAIRAAPALRAAPAPDDAPLAAATLDDLRAAIRDFSGCRLRDTATNPVLPAGNPAGGLLVIGDPPVAEDDRGGQPFSGAAGLVLDRILMGLGLARNDLMLAPLIPWRPPGSRPPTDAEIAQCLPLLHRLIALAQPKRMILTGILPVRALLGGTVTLRRNRGQWKDLVLPGMPTAIPTMPSLSLAGLKTATDRRAVWTDWRMLHRSILLES